MILSDASVERPVFATVISLLLLTFGVLAFAELPLREYPNISPPMVSIMTIYRGASAQVVETDVTQIIENQVGGIEGVRSIRSSSQDGRSSISIEFKLERDMDEAANDVRDRVSRVAGLLPFEIDAPQIMKVDADAQAIQYFTFNSTFMDGLALTDYAERYIVDQLAVIDGVASITVSGAGRYAMRIWLDRIAMTARGLTVTDIENAIRRENVELPAGRIDSATREFSVKVTRSYKSPTDFEQMVITQGDDGHLIRLGEVATVEIGPEDHRRELRGNGIPTVGIGIVKQSTANTLDVLRVTTQRVAEINERLPEGVNLFAVSDSSIFIKSAIENVYYTLAITMVLVSMVIYLFLGSFRAMLIPAVTVPVCLIASFIVMSAFGFSVNLLTMLALVLSIGLVVDDSIVVLENVYRRVEEGEPPLLAAFNGARQVAFAVIATTLVVLAVFIPIAFLPGNIGRVFSELGIAIGSAVVFSTLLALSLTPMMCSKMLRQSDHSGFLVRMVDIVFGFANRTYERSLRATVPHPLFAVLVIVVALGAAAWLFPRIPGEFAPQEDQGQMFAMVMGPEGASFEYMQEKLLELETIATRYMGDGREPAARLLTIVPGFSAADAVNSGMIMVTLKGWRERDMTTGELTRRLAQEWSAVPGVMAIPMVRGGLAAQTGGGPGRGMPVQIVLGGNTYLELAEWRDIIIAEASQNPGFQRVDSDYKETKPQLVVDIDMDRAAALGVSVQNIGRTIETMMSSRRVTTYVDDGEEYNIIMQARDQDRRTPDDLTNIYVRSERSGELIPLTNLTKISNRAEAASLNRYNRMRSVTISASLAPGYTLGEGLEYLENLITERLPSYANIEYAGESREYIESSGDLNFTFMLALVFVFLVLAAQFESFVHPIVIMTTVPLAIVGALIGLYVTGETLNIYSQIGIIMLVGVAAKNGILIVEFANQMRDAGLEFTEALIQAAKLRLRPILMTAISTMMSAIPLVFAVGPGSASRYALGVVIFSGVFVSTALTLFVVPVFYHLLGRHTASPGAVKAQLARLRQQTPAE